MIRNSENGYALTLTIIALPVLLSLAGFGISVWTIHLMREAGHASLHRAATSALKHMLELAERNPASPCAGAGKTLEQRYACAQAQAETTARFVFEQNMPAPTNWSLVNTRFVHGIWYGEEFSGSPPCGSIPCFQPGYKSWDISTGSAAFNAVQYSVSLASRLDSPLLHLVSNSNAIHKDFQMSAVAAMTDADFPLLVDDSY